jgi:hypothetical protein
VNYLIIYVDNIILVEYDVKMLLTFPVFAKTMRIAGVNMSHVSTESGASRNAP